MELCLFGPVSVEFGDRAAAITGGQPARLLRALAVTPRRPVRTDALAEAVWPGDPPANPPKALQTVVMRLRRAVADGLVATVPGGYALGQQVHTDVESCDALVDQGLDPARDPVKRLGALTTALTVAAGEPFAELDEWEPARAESARLTERRARAEDECLALRAEHHGPSPVVADLEAAVARDPTREQRWALLARALRDLNRTADALDALDRARRALAAELGVRPGPLLQALEDELFAGTASPIDDPALRLERHREAADTALADGGVRRAAKELAAAADIARVSERPATAQADLQLGLGRVQLRAGEPDAARAAFSEAARLARHAADTSRLAEAALGASGDAWQSTLDASALAIPLLEESLARLPPAPSPLRARLLARYAVAASHVRDDRELRSSVAQAQAIAGVVDDPLTTATVLMARTVIDQDPYRLVERRAVIDDLMQLAALHGRTDWWAGAIPQLARITAQQGDVTDALAMLDELAAGPSSTFEVAAAAAAGGSAGVLRATVEAPFADVLVAIDHAANTLAATMTDPSAAAILRWAQAQVVGLVYDELVEEEIVTAPMQFPMATMNALWTAGIAAALGSRGRAAEGRELLERVDPAGLGDLPRDLYWLSLLWALGRAVWELEDAERAAALHELAGPVIDLLVVDGAFLFLGAVAHHAGLAAAVAGRATEARELLSTGLSTHERLRSPHWSEASRRALDTLPGRAGESR